MNKYGNRKVITSDGIQHDSQREANRWCELKLLERAGKIRDLKRQVEFVLIPAQYDGRKLVERKCVYIADFVYHNAEDGKLVVEDTKGFRTKEYIIKRKLMRYLNHITITEV